MAALTWRSVDAPDFTPALRGQEIFANLLSNAFAQAKSGLNQYDNKISEGVNNNVLLKFAGIQDPEAAKAALANLATDPSRGRIDAATIASVTGRPEAIIREQSAETGLARDKNILNWSTADRTADQATAALLPQYYAAKALQLKDGGAALGQFYKNNPGFGTGLNIEKTNTVTTGAQGYAQGDLNLATGANALDQSKVRFKWDEEAYNNNKEAQKWKADLIQNTATQEDAYRYLNANRKNMSDSTFNLLYGSIDTSGSGGGSGGSGGGGGGDPSLGDGSRVMNYEARASGFGSVPDTVKTLGDASNFALQVNAANKARIGKPGSSAMGTYQIVGDTLRTYAPKVFGSNWQSQNFDLNAQDKIAEAIFNDNKNSASALQTQWTSLTPDKARSLVGKTWAEARGVIAQGESGVSPQALAARDAVISTGVQTGTMARNADNIAATYAKSAQDTSNTQEVAAKLTALPQFKGMDIGTLSDRIDAIKARAGAAGKTINSAVAADILQRSMTASNVGRYLPTWLGGNDTNVGLYVDDKKADQYIKEYSTGAVERATAGNAAAAGDIQVLGQSKAIYDRALSTYQARVNAQRQGKNVDVAGAASDLAQASIAYAAAQTRTNNGNTTVYNSGGPAPTPSRPASAPAPTVRVAAQIPYKPGPDPNNPPSSKKSFSKDEIFTAYAQGARLNVGHLPGETADQYARRVFHYQEDLARNNAKSAFRGAGNANPASILLRSAATRASAWPTR